MIPKFDCYDASVMSIPHLLGIARISGELHVIYGAKMSMWVNDEEKVQAIIGLLSDEYSRKIVAAAVTEGKSAEQLSDEQNIPVSTCYRRIHNLLALSLLRVSTIDVSNGKKSVFYRSAYKDILIKFESSKMDVKLIPNESSPRDHLAEMLTNVQGKSANNNGNPEIISQDCDLCQSKDASCKIFVAGDSQSHLSICEQCERKMHERNTIRAAEATLAARQRVRQNIMN